MVELEKISDTNEIILDWDELVIINNVEVYFFQVEFGFGVYLNSKRVRVIFKISNQKKGVRNSGKVEIGGQLFLVNCAFHGGEVTKVVLTPAGRKLSLRERIGSIGGLKPC